MLPESIPASVATLLNDVHTWPLPVGTYMAGGTVVALYPYPLLKPLVNKPGCHIKLASPEDIAAMKVVAITQRGTAKDFFDLRALMQTFGMTLDNLVSLVQKKFGVSEDYSYQIKRCLVYFDDAVKSLGDVAVIRNGEQVRLDKREWSEIEKFFKGLVLAH